VSANVQAGHATSTQFYSFAAPNGTIHYPPNGRCWLYTRERMDREVVAGNIWFGKNGSGVPRIKKFLRDSIIGLTPNTLWDASSVGTSDEAKKEVLRLFPEQLVFDTPKPERLLARIIQIATDPGDLVLDAYLGSGTTAAVAHKLDRRYLGIERSAEAVDLCIKRLGRIIDGTEDSGTVAPVGRVDGEGFDVFRQRSSGSCERT
jgi:adenine-specific DNA-methyltransferase